MCQVLLLLVVLSNLIGCASYRAAIQREEERIVREEQQAQVKKQEAFKEAIKKGDLPGSSPARIGMGVLTVVTGVIGLGVTLSDASDYRTLLRKEI